MCVSGARPGGGLLSLVTGRIPRKPLSSEVALIAAKGGKPEALENRERKSRTGWCGCRAAKCQPWLQKSQTETQYRHAERERGPQHRPADPAGGGRGRPAKRGTLAESSRDEVRTVLVCKHLWN